MTANAAAAEALQTLHEVDVALDRAARDLEFVGELVQLGWLPD